ncbi:MAG: hypothetical protein PVJ38_06300, partial [Candidatus Bathyarchaeota archaeon]
MDEKSISYMGFRFPNDAKGKQQGVRLFRAAIYHLSGHSAFSNYPDYTEWMAGLNPDLAQYVVSLLEDTVVNSCISFWYPDKLGDLAFAGALTLRKLRSIESIRVRATRLMSSLTIYVNTGTDSYVHERDRGILEPLFSGLSRIRNTVRESIEAEEEIDPLEKLKTADKIYHTVLAQAPLIEYPSMPHTENLGPCSIYSPLMVGPDFDISDLQKRCYQSLLGKPLEGDLPMEGRAARSEALQVFDSYLFERGKGRKILSRYEEGLSASKLFDIGFPRKDYTEYMIVKTRCKRSTSKMIETLMKAMNEYMEDIRKKYGVLDLSEAIQVIASKSDRSDIFLRDEKIKQSIAWAIIVDASTSMMNVGD